MGVEWIVSAEMARTITIFELQAMQEKLGFTADICHVDGHLFATPGEGCIPSDFENEVLLFSHIKGLPIKDVAIH